MTKKEELHVVKPTTTVEEGISDIWACTFGNILWLIQCFYSLSFVVTALDALVEKRITGFPVIDDQWKLVNLFLF